jgi:rhodanese-related sulfurtransferase
MLGYIAENRLSGIARAVQWNELEDYRARGYEILDVRTPREFARGTIPGSVNIPIDELRERIGEITGSDVVVTCQVGIRGHTATLLLNELGFNALSLDGGYQTWSHSPAKNLVPVLS